VHSSQWTYASAAELAQALGAGKTSAIELARDAIERIESADSALNAMCVKTYEIALAEAAEADARLARGERGPLLGVPMTIKESFNLAGAPTTWGYPEARDYRPSEDALIVSRAKAAGAVILGKTNVPVALDDWQTYNPIYGVTNNPYDLKRTPGGSSGGSAAALAAGFGPLSVGSDIGGSLRVPAHFCGVFAPKPTLNLVPGRGQTPPFLPALPYSDDLAVVGPMARAAGDLVALFDSIAGPDELVDGVGYRLALPPARATALTEFRVLAIAQHPLAYERRVDRELLDELKRVSGKQNLLFDLAGAALEQPDGIVRDVVFPVVGEQTLRDLVKEAKATGPSYRTTLRTVIRNSYKGHYRRMVPEIIQRLEFRSNNDHHRPIIQALDLLKRYAGTKLQTFPVEEMVPLDDIVKGLWREAVFEKDAQGRQHVNRITYEIGVLEALRDKLRCKEVWVVGANRYRNPDEDLPADFEAQRTPYYQALKLPLEADRFIADLDAEMREALHALDAGMPRNRRVKISRKRNKEAWITVTPFDPQPDPPNLTAIKAETLATWPMTNLLDMLKETDLRLNFTDVLKSATAHENLDHSVLRPRLLLCLNGLGTNAGFQRMAGLQSGTTAKDLAYVRRRYITVDSLRQAIAIVTNGTLRARNPAVWGDGTTACASDSKHFGAWDQNLTTQWHMRYGGRGVMIYWHVERNSLCIHSQLKSPSSSEVASMIEGVVHHCTEMEVDRQYVDSHGQSTVAFAFCRLLGFQLMPRLKAIHVQKLSRPDVGQADAYPNLQPILTKPIDWELIRQQYDQMVKYVTAVRLGTAETESILRRFVRSNTQHPTYKAFAELGRAVKTVFLCRYLHSEELRREINEGLNVIEQWNSANDFIFFARRGEMVSNRREDHEISMLALHLLQNCMVYINTLMLQQLLAQPSWSGKLTPRDLRALTPLIWEHVNPYGRFELDMDARLPLA
jgi:TnpA family transposase/Asp-tRNA(Asn)/Glu-tRNA(Gln) amidotransferase A subunit family amidase